VDAFARQSIEINRHGRGEGFTFAGLHFGNIAIIENESANDLDFERLLLQNTPRGFPSDGKSFVFDLFERSSIG
jgi:hypothetical protein